MNTPIETASRHNSRLRSAAFAIVAISVGLQVASAGSTTTRLVSSVNPSQQGQAVTFRADVYPPTATRTVSFGTYSEIRAIVPLNAQGIATYTTTYPSNLGNEEIRAFYSGDASNLPSESDSFIQVVTLDLYPPIALTPNILVNPGAENLQTILYDWTGSGTYSASSPHTGLYCFVSGPSPAFLSQTVSLLQFVSGEEINTDTVFAGFSYWYRSTEQHGAPPTFQITLTFYDKNNYKLGQGRSTIRTGQSAWLNDAGSVLIPSLSVKVVYTMDILYGEGFSYVDDNVLTVTHVPLTANLLADPGAESGAVAPNWWPAAGTTQPTVVTGSSYFGAGGNDAHSGKYVFYGGQTSAAYLSQTIYMSKVITWQLTLAKLDAGAYTVNYSFWFANRNPSPASFGRITLTFYDTNKIPISQSLSPPVVATSWTNQSGSFPIPPLTRYIVYSMDFNSPGLLDTGVFDDNVLTIGSTVPPLN